MFALTIAAAAGGALAAACAAAICAVALTIDVPAVLRRVSTHAPRPQGSVPETREATGRARAAGGATPAV